MSLQDDLRAALDRAGDAEERAAKAEMEILALKDRLAAMEGTAREVAHRQFRAEKIQAILDPNLSDQDRREIQAFIANQTQPVEVYHAHAEEVEALKKALADRKEAEDLCLRGPPAESLMKTALETRDRCHYRQQVLQGYLRGYFANATHMSATDASLYNIWRPFR